MGVYIPNLEIPTSCFDCPVSHPALGNLGAAILGCPLIGKTLSAPFCEEKRMDNCPLAPVPPHGDLIDRDPFVQFIKSHWDSSDQWFVEQLEARPTIIPADPAEEGEA